MKVYRIIKTKYANDAWLGKGAAIAGGRWNSKDVAMVYASDSLALAQLEVLVHLQDSPHLTDFSYFVVDIPESDLRRLEPQDLPDDWDSEPSGMETRHIGDEWVQSESSIGLIVPSATSPESYNVLLNPGMDRFKELVLDTQPKSFAFDKRLNR